MSVKGRCEAISDQSFRWGRLMMGNCSQAESTNLEIAAADGTRVWDLQTMQEIRGPSSGGIMGATTSIMWIKREDNVGEVLFYGMQKGYIVRWRQRSGSSDFEEHFCDQLAKPGEVTGLAFDPHSNRLAVCHRNGVVQVHLVDSTMNLREAFVKTIPNSSPQAIAFGAMDGKEKEVLVFNLYSGHIHIIHRGELVGKWNVGTYIGGACIDASKSTMCLADPIYGITVHRLEDEGLRKVKSFKIPVTKKTRVRNVCFVNHGREVVGGSDHREAYVFDRKDGHTIDRLRIDSGGWAQTVTATDCNGIPPILAAKSLCDDSASNEIFVWSKRGVRRCGRGEFPRRRFLNWVGDLVAVE
ncbi:hypothetical protein B0H13DRAFT_2388960 [Mycena leptocephala]|nr:hypothetical protein B0H13DRAFT_2388960 [Mycena leptocephala]